MKQKLSSYLVMWCFAIFVPKKIFQFTYNMDLTGSLFDVLENQNRMSNGHLSEYSLAFFWTLGYILMHPNPHIPHINQG